jgi:hypothetical protein
LQRIRSTRIGSTTSTRSGPTRVRVRSSGARPDARVEICSPPWTTLMPASITPRLGYTPRATAKNSDPSVS